MKILVACEESQVVTKELRRLGHEAYSCDIIECSGGHPELHIMGDALNVLNPEVLFPGELPGIQFFTMDNEYHCFEGLPSLQPTEIVKPEKGRRFQQKNGNWRYSCWEMDQRGGKERARERSKTFPGIAKAMAEQWGGECND